MLTRNKENMKERKKLTLMKEFLEAQLRGVIIIQAVIPVEAGIQKQQKTGFRIKCGMTAFLCLSVFRYLAALLRGSSLDCFLILSLPDLIGQSRERTWILWSSRRMTVLNLTFMPCALGAGFLTIRMR